MGPSFGNITIPWRLRCCKITVIWRLFLSPGYYTRENALDSFPAYYNNRLIVSLRSTITLAEQNGLDYSCLSKFGYCYLSLFMLHLLSLMGGSIICTFR